MAILTVSEQADMLKRLATNVMDHGTAQLYPAYAQAILDVLAALEDARAKLNAVPFDAIRSVFNAADNDGYYNDDVYEWLVENKVNP